MRPLFDHRTVLNHQDLVRLTDSAEAMGENEAGSSPHQRNHSLLEMKFRAGHTAGGFIQDENSRFG